MIQDIKTFETFEEAEEAPLGDFQLSISQATGDYLDMYEAVYTVLDENDHVIGFQKVIAMFEPEEGRLRSLIFENGYGRHFIKPGEEEGIEVAKLKRIEHSME